MYSIYNYYTVGELLDDLFYDEEFATGGYSYYIENGEIKY